jgi:hypothetical protein
MCFGVVRNFSKPNFDEISLTFRELSRKYEIPLLEWHFSKEFFIEKCTKTNKFLKSKSHELRLGKICSFSTIL